jgi:hypothetical protein
MERPDPQTISRALDAISDMREALFLITEDFKGMNANTAAEPGLPGALQSANFHLGEAQRMLTARPDHVPVAAEQLLVAA